MHHPTDRIAHTTAFVTPVVEHWLEREIAPVSVKSASMTTRQTKTDVKFASVKVSLSIMYVSNVCK